MTPQSLYAILIDLGMTLGSVYAKFTKSIVMPNESGQGLLVDPDAPAYGWRDITGPIETRGLGATDPDWAQISGSIMSAFKFSLNDTCWIPFHIPHDYVPGTDIHFHVHWLSDGTDVVNTVKWQFDYMFAKGFGQEAYPIAALPTPETAEQASAGQYYGMVTETAGITIPGLEVDGILYLKLTRITNGATDNANGIFVLTSDVHYQSTNMATKGKAPNFYT